MLFILTITLYLSYLLIFKLVPLCLCRAKNRVVFAFCLCLDAYESAKLLCEQYYLGAPELELRQMNGETHMKHCDKTHTVFYRWLICMCIEH